MEQLKEKLLDLLKKKAVKTGQVKLSSGKISDFYIDGRLITLEPEGAWLIANLVLDIIEKDKFSALGGPTLGADPIVGAVACLAHTKNLALKAFIVRKEAKAHGMSRQIEGPELEASDKVVLIDDVATSGKSLIEAKKALEAVGIKSDTAIVIVDREEGAKENLAKEGIRLISIFNRKSFGI